MQIDTNSGLILPNLSITGFRGIESLEIPRLGRVTLIAGKNGVGKTTILNAVRVFAARASYPVLMNMMQELEEVTTGIDWEGDKFVEPDLGALFHGRRPVLGSSLLIGPTDETQQLKITLSLMSEDEAIQWKERIPIDFSDDAMQMLVVSFHDTKQEIPVQFPLRDPRILYRRLRRESKEPTAIQCESLGPSLPNPASMSRYWDMVALTDNEDRAIEALRLIHGDDVERIAMVGDSESPRRAGRRAVVKITGQNGPPVPLKSLGDGAIRLFGVAMALASSRECFMGIDEAENGIHHSVQPDFWKMILRTAHENNVQVLATTHGWDSVVGFAQAAIEVQEGEGRLIRLERDGDRMRAVEYSQEGLQTAAEQGIEVR